MELVCCIMKLTFIDTKAFLGKNAGLCEGNLFRICVDCMRRKGVNL